MEFSWIIATPKNAVALPNQPNYTKLRKQQTVHYMLDSILKMNSGAVIYMMLLVDMFAKLEEERNQQNVAMLLKKNLKKLLLI